MCGIAGIYNLNQKPVDQERLVAMTKIIRHRGPDDEGYLLVNTSSDNMLHCHNSDTLREIQATTKPIPNDFTANLAFGFRRLSIIDISPKGHQPMSNGDGSIWIVFNGEIFNYIELRDELKSLGHNFVSKSDTEVIIKSYEQWGEACLNRFNGMWAFALWDNQSKTMFCARDRFGVKPFNYYFDGNSFIFGSEVKQILEWPIEKTINQDVIFKSFAIGGFLHNSNTTYFDKIKILPHSHYIIIKNNQLEIKRYYDLNPAQFETSKLPFTDACEQYRDLFTDAVKLRMRSDVEVGSTLSGGLDSSAIVSIATGFTPKQFKTFTSYYTHDPKFDERKWAELVVNKTNSISHYVSANAEQVMEDIGKITWHHDYPIPGSSPIAQYYVMQLTHNNNVTVLLDGQGSDEILGGYMHTFYRYYADLITQFRWGKFIKEYPSYLAHIDKGSTISKILKTNLSLLFSEKTLYRNEACFAFNPLSVKYHSDMDFSEIRNLKSSRVSNFLYNQIMSTSIQTLLHFEDRNSMAHSIESRVPFLDYRFVEFAFSLPAPYKLHKNFGKYIHREALKTIVPSEIMERKDKLGFLAPGEFYWMRNEMKNYYLTMLQSPSFRNREIFDHKLIESEYQKYLRGNNTNARGLWMIMALEIWFRKFVDGTK
jgi:asparagine synthase (glutamine-hydrolysing)